MLHGKLEVTLLLTGNRAWHIHERAGLQGNRTKIPKRSTRAQHMTHMFNIKTEAGLKLKKAHDGWAAWASKWWPVWVSHGADTWLGRRHVEKEPKGVILPSSVLAWEMRMLKWSGLWWLLNGLNTPTSLSTLTYSVSRSLNNTLCQWCTGEETLSDSI